MESVKPVIVGSSPAGAPSGGVRADEDLLRDALLENLHRSQLNPLEEAAAYAQLLEDFGCTHDELAQRWTDWWSATAAPADARSA